MEKWDLLKLFQEWGEEGMMKNDGGGEFKYDIFDTLKNFCNATTINKIKNFLKRKKN
jgi:hypothetical protein